VGITRVDSHAAHVAAQIFSDSADILDAEARGQLSRIEFDGATAGRQYTGRGDSVHAELDRLASQMIQWSRASAEIGSALLSGADEYVAADERAAMGMP
jgi:hypothetical protein